MSILPTLRLSQYRNLVYATPSLMCALRVLAISVAFLMAFFSVTGDCLSSIFAPAGMRV